MKPTFLSLLIFLFFFSSEAHTQDELRFQDTIIVEGIDKDEMYLRSLLWFKREYSKSKIGLLEYADLGNGVVSGYSRVLYKQEVKLANQLANGIIEYDIHLQLEDGSCVYTLSNFTHYGNIKSEVPFDYGLILDDELCMSDPPELQIGKLHKSICEHIFTTIQVSTKLKIDALKKTLSLPDPNFFGQEKNSYIEIATIEIEDKNKEEVFDICAGWIVENYGSEIDSMDVFDPSLGHIAKEISFPFELKSFVNKGAKGNMKYYLSFQIEDQSVRIIACDFTHRATIQKGLEEIHLGYIIEDEKCTEYKALSSKYISKTCTQVKELLHNEIQQIATELNEVINP